MQTKTDNYFIAKRKFDTVAVYYQLNTKKIIEKSQ